MTPSGVLGPFAVLEIKLRLVSCKSYFFSIIRFYFIVFWVFVVVVLVRFLLSLQIGRNKCVMCFPSTVLGQICDRQSHLDGRNCEKEEKSGKSHEN